VPYKVEGLQVVSVRRCAGECLGRFRKAYVSNAPAQAALLQGRGVVPGGEKLPGLFRTFWRQTGPPHFRCLLRSMTKGAYRVVVRDVVTGVETVAQVTLR